jgi:hypothetical protein
VSVARAERTIAAEHRVNVVYAVGAALLALVAGVLFWRFLSGRRAAA